jgi:hypothetical protein
VLELRLFYFYKNIYKKKENKIMELAINPRNGMLKIEDARIIFRNFAGAGSTFNREGDRNFALVIPTEEIAEMLINDKNADGAGWNVKIKPSNEEGEPPRMNMMVKVKFNDNGPNIYLKSGKAMIRITEDKVKMLDNIRIQSVDLDIRPYDSIVNGKAYRTAYLAGMKVIQAIDRFTEEYEEYMQANSDEDELPFN